MLPTAVGVTVGSLVAVLYVVARVTLGLFMFLLRSFVITARIAVRCVFAVMIFRLLFRSR